MENSEIIIKALENDKDFMKSGRRNNDVVDLSIAVFDKVKGNMKDFDESIEKYFERCRNNLDNNQAILAKHDFKYRLKYIRKYLEKWYDTDDIYYFLTQPLLDYKNKLEKGDNNE